MGEEEEEDDEEEHKRIARNAITLAASASGHTRGSYFESRAHVQLRALTLQKARLFGKID